MRNTPTTAVLAALLLTVGCSYQSDEPEARRVESPELGIVLADIPETFEVVADRGGPLALAPVDPAVGGRVLFSLRVPEVGGINLVGAVHKHQARIEGLPSGDYRGARELRTPHGPAFYSRGRYERDGNLVEDTHLFMLHPTGDKMLDIAYTYPAADDSSERIESLINVIAEIEGMGSRPQESGVGARE